MGPPRDPASPPDRRPRRAIGVAAALAGVLGLALLLRVPYLDRNSGWYDEFASFEVAMGHDLAHTRLPAGALLEAPRRLTSLADAAPASAIWTSMRLEQHPPLYFLMLRGWSYLFGASDVAGRALSTLACLAALVLLFDAARLLQGAAAGVHAALLLAVSTQTIDLSLLTRNYLPMLAWALGACAATARLERRGASAPRCAALGLCALGAMLTHYFALGACVAVGLYAAIRLRGRARRGAAVALGAAGVVFAVAWGPMLLAQFGNFAANVNYLADDAPGRMGRLLERVAAMPMELLARPQGRTRWIEMLAAALYVLPFMLARRRPDLLLWGLLLGCTVGLVAALDALRQTQQLALPRYVIAAAPASAALIAALAGNLRIGARRRLAAAAAHAVPLLVALNALLAAPDARRAYDGDWRVLAAAVAPRLASGEVLVCIGGERGDWFTRWLWLGLDRYLDRPPTALLLLDAPATDAVAGELRRRGAVVVSGLDVDVRAYIGDAEPVKIADEPQTARAWRLAWPPP